MMEKCENGHTLFIEGEPTNICVDGKCTVCGKEVSMQAAEADALGNKPGDRIEYVGVDSNLKGLKGTIVTMLGGRGDSNYYGIEFDKNIGKHDCHGNCKKGHGYYVPKAEVKRIADNKPREPTQSTRSAGPGPQPATKPTGGFSGDPAIKEAIKQALEDLEDSPDDD